MGEGAAVGGGGSRHSCAQGGRKGRQHYEGGRKGRYHHEGGTCNQAKPSWKTEEEGRHSQEMTADVGEGKGSRIFWLGSQTPEEMLARESQDYKKGRPAGKFHKTQLFRNRPKGVKQAAGVTQLWGESPLYFHGRRSKEGRWEGEGMSQLFPHSKGARQDQTEKIPMFHYHNHSKEERREGGRSDAEEATQLLVVTQLSMMTQTLEATQF